MSVVDDFVVNISEFFVLEKWARVTEQILVQFRWLPETGASVPERLADWIAGWLAGWLASSAEECGFKDGRNFIGSSRAKPDVETFSYDFRSFAKNFIWSF